MYTEEVKTALQKSVLRGKACINNTEFLITTEGKKEHIQIYPKNKTLPRREMIGSNAMAGLEKLRSNHTEKIAFIQITD